MGVKPEIGDLSFEGRGHKFSDTLSSLVRIRPCPPRSASRPESQMMAGIDMLHVPDRGGAPALIDLLSGQVQVMFDAIPRSIEYIRDGKLRALAVTTATRSPALPDVPSMGDFVPGFEAGSWWGVAAPRATPSDITDRLNREFNSALADPHATTRLAEL